MSACVHVGQCGNQLGAAYWRLVGSDDYEDDVSGKMRSAPPPKARKVSRAAQAPSSSVPSLYYEHFYLRPSTKARCVLVDTEPKVIRSMLESDDAHSFCRTWPRHHEPAFVHFEQSGRGNNWAMGYNFQRFQRNVIPSKTTMTQPHSNSIASSKSRSCPVAKFTPFDEDKRELMELTMDSLRKLIESTDCYQGTVLMHSLGGGTGSGLGCRLMELIRDTYPKSYLVAASVAPSWKCGDTPLQNYNSVFTLAHLQEHADCIIYKENDELLRTAGYWKALTRAETQDQSQQDNLAGNLSSSGPPSRRVSIDEMNHLAAADLAGLLFPLVPESNSASSRPVSARPFDFGKLVHDLSPFPSAKFLDVRTGVLKGKSSSSTSTKASKSDPMLFHAGICQHQLTLRSGGDGEVESILNKLVRQTAQSFPRSASHTLSSSAIIRGFPTPNDCNRSTKLQAAVASAFPGVLWNPDYHTAVSHSSLAPFPSNGSKASVTLCVNNGHVLTSAEQYLQRAERQFKARAYVHWYVQHGLEESHFQHAFEKSRQLIAEYKDLLR
ncbi:Cryptic tubulin, partial [Globisporangium splendens]